MSSPELEAARRNLRKQFAVRIVDGMRYRDVSFEDLESRIGISAPKLRRFVHNLIEGKAARGDQLDDIAVIMHALDIPISIRLVEKPKAEPVAKEAKPAATE